MCEGRCNVRSIVFEGARATGVIVKSSTELFEIMAGEVILAGGAYASPQILMLSGVGPASELEQHDIPIVADLQGVGKNLRDHPQVQLTFSTKPDFDQGPLEPRIQNALVKVRFGRKRQLNLRMVSQILTHTL
jgi:choline dehydrogenase